MATVTKEMADQIIARNGYYPGDPRVTKVVKYKSNWGTECYALVWGHENQLRYEESPDCHDVEVLWMAQPTTKERTTN